jgi:hypothetical protein
MSKGGTHFSSTRTAGRVRDSPGTAHGSLMAAPAEVMDAGIIAAAQRVEHYEMAGYGTVQLFAKLLGEKEAAELFTLTLNEEKAAVKKLSLLAKSFNVKAKAEKPPASVKTAVKKSAKPPVKISSGGQIEAQGIESNMEAKQSQPE